MGWCVLSVCSPCYMVETQHVFNYCTVTCWLFMRATSHHRGEEIGCADRPWAVHQTLLSGGTKPMWCSQKEHGSTVGPLWGQPRVVGTEVGKLAPTHCTPCPSCSLLLPAAVALGLRHELLRSGQGQVWSQPPTYPCPHLSQAPHGNLSTRPHKYPREIHSSVGRSDFRLQPGPTPPKRVALTAA